MDDEIDERLTAHRAAFAALAMVIGDITPGAMDAIILALDTFVNLMRQQNYPAATVAEMRTIRDHLASIAAKIPADPFPGTPQPPADSDPS